jgi:hypothetical protein
MWWNYVSPIASFLVLLYIVYRAVRFERRARQMDKDIALRQRDLDQLSMAVRAHRKTLIDLADSCGLDIDQVGEVLERHLKNEHDAYLEARRQTLGAGTNGKHLPGPGGKT